VSGSAMNGSPDRSSSVTADFPARRWFAGNATHRSSVATTCQESSPVSGTGSQATATSTSALASPAVGSRQETWRKVSFQPGSSCAIRAVTAGMSPRPILVWNPIRNAMSAAAAASATALWASSHWPRSSRARVSMISPALVSRTVRWSRSKSRARSEVSSSRICLLSVGWAMKSRSFAARVKLSSSATATKYRRSRRCASIAGRYGKRSWTGTRRRPQDWFSAAN